MKDRFGREFVVGATVTYPVRNGSNMEMVDGVIVEVIPTERRKYNFETSVYENVEWATLCIRAKGLFRKKATLRTVTEVDRVTVVCMKHLLHIPIPTHE